MDIYRFPRVAISLNEAGKKGVPQKVQILRTGEFTDPRYGTFEITAADLLTMKKNFDAKVRGVDLAIDYAHESDQVAAGWIKGLELSTSGNELWATVEWTPQGAKRLSDKEFRYLSADFAFDYKNNETGNSYGPTLFGAGLTNRPVVKNMAPAVELTERKDKEMKTVEQLQSEIKTLTEQSDAMKKALGEMTADQAIAKIATLETEKAGLAKEVGELKAKVDGFEQAQKLAEKSASFNKLMSEGKAVEAQREHFMSGDMVKFAAAAGKVNLSEKGNGAQPPEATTSDTTKAEAEKKILTLAEKMVEEKKSVGLAQAISEVRKQNPDLVKAMNQ
jgi:phage I-like protein